MGGISANHDGDNRDDILSRGMKDPALGEGLIINCSSSCSNREIKSRKRGGGEGTNPARKNLSLCAVSFLPLARVRVRSHGCLRDIDAILHSNAGQEASASLVLKPRHRHPLGTVPLSSSYALLYSHSLSRARKETQQK